MDGVVVAADRAVVRLGGRARVRARVLGDVTRVGPAARVHDAVLAVEHLMEIVRAVSRARVHVGVGLSGIAFLRMRSAGGERTCGNAKPAQCFHRDPRRRTVNGADRQINDEAYRCGAARVPPHECSKLPCGRSILVEDSNARASSHDDARQVAPVTGKSTGGAIDTRPPRLSFRNIRDQPSPTHPHDQSPSGKNQKECESAVDVVDVAELIVDVSLEAADLTGGSCFDALPNCFDVLPDCAVVDCDPGCA